MANSTKSLVQGLDTHNAIMLPANGAGNQGGRGLRSRTHQLALRMAISAHGSTAVNRNDLSVRQSLPSPRAKRDLPYLFRAGFVLVRSLCCHRRRLGEIPAKEIINLNMPLF